MKSILSAYRKGLPFNIKMHDNGLIWQGEKGKSLTWMDAVTAGKPVTPREGYAVEINALWYNAVCYTLELAKEFNDKKFIDEWKDMPEKIKQSFLSTFWCDKCQYLHDVVTDNDFDKSVRPNQIFATSLPYSMLTDDQKERILAKVEKELLTAKGIRTLSPKNVLYKGRYEGNQEERDKAYHQGTVWPWLLGHFIEGYIKIHGKNALPLAEKVVNSFKEDMTAYGLCSISEIYDGDPPYKPKGSISQAWSVAEVLRIMQMIKKLKK